MKSVALGALLLAVLPLHAQFKSDTLPLAQDSVVQKAVPQGQLIKLTVKVGPESVYPGTEREVTVYLPVGLDRSKPAPFMVFQDGVIYKAPTVFDNLIHAKAIPPLIGVFVRPGVVPSTSEAALPRFNRSLEYDAVSEDYSKFVLGELLPRLEKELGIQFSQDGNDGAISGSSSGGIAAWMTAWHRSDRFRRVYTSVGTYVGLRGGNDCASQVRKTEPKPIRVFLQDGSNDINGYGGNWFIANQDMESALTWAGYEVNHEWGDGGHNHKHATVVFPQAMRWLWKDWQTSKDVNANPQKTKNWKGHLVLAEGSAWQEAGAADGAYLSLSETGKVAAASASNTRLVGADGKQLSVGIKAPHLGITLSPDQSLVYYTHPDSAYVMSAQRQADGSLKYPQKFVRLHEPDAETSGASGLCVDELGWIYVATKMGIQVSDQAGRVNFIFPTQGPATDVCFGGSDLQTLYVTAGGKVYQRPMKVKGVRSDQAPVKPAAPRL